MQLLSKTTSAVVQILTQLFQTASSAVSSHSHLRLVNLVQYTVIPQAVLELQLTIGNVEKHPGPAAECATLFSKVIQGHFSRGHKRFGELAGLQCVAKIS